MTQCPGYLSITVNDRQDLEEIARYDALVSCPTEFNITISLPNLNTNIEKTFDVILDDAKTTFHVFLTTLLMCRPATHESLAIQPSSAKKEDSIEVYSWLIPATVSAIVSTAIALGLTAHIRSELKLSKHGRMKYPHSEIQQNGKSSNIVPPVRFWAGKHGFRSLSVSRKIVICLYAGVSVIYSVVFTFTVLSSLTYLLLEPKVASLLSLRLNHIGQSARQVAMAVHWDKEMNRHARLGCTIQKACDRYGEELVESFSPLFPSPNTASIPDFFSGLCRTLALYQVEMNNYSTEYRNHVNIEMRHTMKRFRVLAEQILRNGWFAHAKSLWGRHSSPTQLVDERVLTLKDVQMTLEESLSGGQLKQDAVKFTQFLDLHEIHGVLSWMQKFWDR